MQSILIQNNDRSIVAEVLPDYGGMVARLRLNGRDVLYLDESRLVDSPLIRRRIPVLFPFAGRIANDCYMINGIEYHMPMHGLVKNRTFAIKDQSEEEVTVWVAEDEALLCRNYPFLHTLEITYRILHNALIIIAHIENRSREPMPHTLGWHPYFKASNSTLLAFHHNMAVHYDYNHEKDMKTPASISLTQHLDDVYCKPLFGEYTLTNSADGYQVRCNMDDAFQSIVVFTGKPGSVCIEPWCGIPDSINNGRMIQWLPAGQTKVYKVEFHLAVL